MANFVELIKQIAGEANEDSMPCGLFFGEVISTAPLQIIVEQKLILDSTHLILSSLVRDFTVDMTVDHKTESALGVFDLEHAHSYWGLTEVVNDHNHYYEGSVDTAGEKLDFNHTHKYAGPKSFTLHLGLQVGENVVMLRVQGGQQYFVLDRLR